LIVVFCDLVSVIAGKCRGSLGVAGGGAAMEGVGATPFIVGALRTCDLTKACAGSQAVHARSPARKFC
jgi:hypothetical protein